MISSQLSAEMGSPSAYGGFASTSSCSSLLISVVGLIGSSSCGLATAVEIPCGVRAISAGMRRKLWDKLARGDPGGDDMGVGVAVVADYRPEVLGIASCLCANNGQHGIPKGRLGADMERWIDWSEEPVRDW